MLLLTLLRDFDLCNRKYYVFDSFEGLPSIEKIDANGTLRWGKKGLFKADLEDFKNNLERFHVNDNRTLVVSKGWFRDTCHRSPVQNITFLRLDGDIYSSTVEALNAFYHKVVPGGLVYIDDYGTFNGCRAAVNEFRLKHGVTEEIQYILESDKNGTSKYEAVWWRKR